MLKRETMQMNRENILLFLENQFKSDLNTIVRNLRKIKREFPEVHQSILKETDYLPQDDSINLSVRLYHIINGLHSCPVCKNPNCNNHVKFNSINNGYFEYCSRACTSQDPSVRKKVEETSIRKFGSKCSLQNEVVKEKSKQTCL